MMENKRIHNLLGMLAVAPDDPFVPYALALEYAAEGQPQKASEWFDKVLRQFPDYLPSYYIAGEFYFRNGEASRAAEVLGKGIALAQQQGQAKTLAELRMLYEEVVDE